MFVVGCALILAIVIAVIVICVIRKKNAEKNRISGSQELLTDREPKLVEQGTDFEPTSIYGQYRLPPIGHSATSQSYDQASIGDASVITGYTATSTLGDYPSYIPQTLNEYDYNNVMINPRKKSHRATEHDPYDDSPRKHRKHKKSKKLKPLRGSDHLSPRTQTPDLHETRRSHYGLSLKLEPPQESAEIQAEEEEVRANTLNSTLSPNATHSADSSARTDAPITSTNGLVPRLELKENSV